MKKYIVNLIGFILMMVGIGLMTVTSSMEISGVFLFVGILLFASFKVEAAFFDYVIANKKETMVRKRIYINFLPFQFVSMILTLGKAPLKIPVFEKYYVIKALDPKTLAIGTKAFITDDDEAVSGLEGCEIVKISLKEYRSLWKEQTKIYKSGQLSKEFINEFCGENSDDVKSAKRKLILAIIFTLVSLRMITPGDMFSVGLSMLYVVIFLPMVILWIPDLIKEKAKQKAYEEANKSISSQGNV